MHHRPRSGLRRGCRSGRPTGMAFDDAEPHLDQVHPPGRRRGEVHSDTQVPGEPDGDLGLRVRGVVVHCQMPLTGRKGAGDILQKSEEFQVSTPGPVTLPVAILVPRTGWWCGVAGGVVGWRSGIPTCICNVGAIRSSSWIWDFSSAQSTIAFSGGFMQEPEDVGDVAGQFRIGGELERLRQPRLHPVFTPYLRHSAVRDTDASGQRPRTSMCDTVCGALGQSGGDQLPRFRVRSRPDRYSSSNPFGRCAR